LLGGSVGRRLVAAILIALAVVATSAQASGFRSIEAPASGDRPAMTGGMWYPCSSRPGEINLGPITIIGTKDCPIRGANLPLIVISHGNVGAWFDHHDTAAALADAGFVVAAISHRGDNTINFGDGADPSVMPGRAGDMKRLVDFMLEASPAATVINPDRIGFFGFSAGGLTGLELAGASPDWPPILCRFSPALRACMSVMGRRFRAEPADAEPRIKAYVLADPPGFWLARDSLAAVTAPIQLWASETGGRGLPNIGVTPESVAAVDEGLPQKHEYHVVANAGHFAFMLCGPSIKAVPEYCADAVGFDRVAFHKKFNAEVVRFFRARIGGQ
jgi:predicted dienelactone hydrolase